MNDEICRVCRAAPGRQRYGSWACDSCKIFFLRAATRTVPFVCKRNNDCKQPEEKCPGCRWQLCLNAGLIPEIAGRRSGCLRRQINEAKAKRPWQKSRPSGDRSAREAEEPELPISPDFNAFDESGEDMFFPDQPSTSSGRPFVPAKQPQLQLVPRIGKPRMSYENFPLTFTGSSLAQLLSSMRFHESFCNGSERGVQPIREDFPFNFDVDFSDAINNPLALCPRVPIEFSLNMSVKRYPRPAQLFARIVLHMIDWYRSLPEIWSLSPQDRVRLCSRQVLMLYPILILFHSYFENFDGLLVGLGSAYTLDKEIRGEFSKLRDFLPICAAFYRNVLFPGLTRMKFTRDDYLLFKNIVIFHSGLGLTDQGAEIVRKARHKYEALLVQHLTEACGDERQAIAKLVKLMDLLNIFVDFGNKHNLYFSQLITLDSSLMSGRFIDEIYFKSDLF